MYAEGQALGGRLDCGFLVSNRRWSRLKRACSDDQITVCRTEISETAQSEGHKDRACYVRNVLLRLPYVRKIRVHDSARHQIRGPRLYTRKMQNPHVRSAPQSSPSSERATAWRIKEVKELCRTTNVRLAASRRISRSDVSAGTPARSDRRHLHQLKRTPSKPATAV